MAAAAAAAAMAAAANNKFIAADEVHKLIITSRQRVLPRRVPIQTITDDLQHNGARLTDATVHDYARTHARHCPRNSEGVVPFARNSGMPRVAVYAATCVERGKVASKCMKSLV
jgi:hypothetical protein